MRNIVIFGAGKSSVCLIKELQHSLKVKSKLTLVALSFSGVPKVLLEHKNTHTVLLDVSDTLAIEKLIEKQDLVISMLPANLHVQIAELCLRYSKNMLTASYVSEKMKQLHQKAVAKGVLFLNEMGLDPGLDHMSALSAIAAIKKRGGKLYSFKSHTGGLVKKSEKTNAWNYKFTWSPMNVVIAGAEGATYLFEGREKEITYNRLFGKVENIEVQSNFYDSYANRNSLNYIKKYGLEDCETVYRGTLRHKGFCEAWNIFVQLGMTDNDQQIKLPEESSRKDFLNFFLEDNTAVKAQFCKQTGIVKGGVVYAKMDQLGLFDESLILEKTQGTAAQILLAILEHEWKLSAKDLDCVVMLHEIEYELDGVKQKQNLSLYVEGEDHCYTAMAKTVGLPMYEAAILMLQNKIGLTGVQIPTNPIIYNPILKQLKAKAISFTEKF
ncbi:saccharopine dehydrogenase C-terminal domain-containing protein [Aquimarina agarilytica]|uniref:saccharopine dehydrogenase C-terminal domain-containing protein n=1 Tax=Aquimarina agarilytica TaxID=1087449 RepID=UPI0002896860|nr:saccharopine dehydrogenase C-terminal domain-containing protein [Aquimarina agarilytica]